MGVVRNLRQVAADDVGVDIAFRADVHAGLAQRRKAIPARWFYDATGSALFEDITALPEYSPTRSQTELPPRHAPAHPSATGSRPPVVERRSGTQTTTPPAPTPSTQSATESSGE